MVTITNKATGKTYNVTTEAAQKIKTSENASKFIIGKIEEQSLPELESLKNNAGETTPETVSTANVENISENVEGIESNETKAETVRTPRKRTPKVD